MSIKASCRHVVRTCMTNPQVVMGTLKHWHTGDSAVLPDVLNSDESVNCNFKGA